MILLPHLFVLQYLKKQFQYLRTRPDQLEYLLSGFRSCDLGDVYGDKFIQDAIEWFRTREVFFVLGSRLDMAKLPSIAVTYEGGTESDMFVGDEGGTMQIKIPQRMYGSFQVVKTDGKTITVYPENAIRKKLWRGLVVKKDGFSGVIDELVKDANGYVVLTLDQDAPNFLGEWNSFSPLTQKHWSIGSSMDSVVVKVYMQIDGEPELAETVSAIVRYLLKQSRMHLANNGLYETRMGHSALSRSMDYEESQVWVVEFSISGTLHDQWVLTESEGVDRIDLDVLAKDCNPANETVLVYSTPKE